MTFQTVDNKLLYYDRKSMRDLCPGLDKVIEVPFTSSEVVSFLQMIDLHDAARIATHLNMTGQYPRHPAFWFNYFRDTLMRSMVDTTKMFAHEPNETELAMLKEETKDLAAKGVDFSDTMTRMYEASWPHFVKWTEHLLKL